MTIQLIVPIIGFLITIGLAISKYLYEDHERKRNERVERIERQLKHLYGPLFALVQSRDKSWKIFESKCRVQDWDRKEQRIPNEDRTHWELWMKEEFRFTNDKIYHLIIENADLYIEDGLPRCFETFIAHHTQYRIIISKWDRKEYDELFAETQYPTYELNAYVKKSFYDLKKTQYHLIKHRHELKPEEPSSKSAAPKKPYANYGAE